MFKALDNDPNDPFPLVLRSVPPGTLESFLGGAAAGWASVLSFLSESWRVAGSAEFYALLWCALTLSPGLGVLPLSIVFI